LLFYAHLTYGTPAREARGVTFKNMLHPVLADSCVPTDALIALAPAQRKYVPADGKRAFGSEAAGRAPGQFAEPHSSEDGSESAGSGGHQAHPSMGYSERMPSSTAAHLPKSRGSSSDSTRMSSQGNWGSLSTGEPDGGSDWSRLSIQGNWGSRSSGELDGWGDRNHFRTSPDQAGLMAVLSGRVLNYFRNELIHTDQDGRRYQEDPLKWFFDDFVSTHRLMRSGCHGKVGSASSSAQPSTASTSTVVIQGRVYGDDAASCSSAQRTVMLQEWNNRPYPCLKQMLNRLPARTYTIRQADVEVTSTPQSPSAARLQEGQGERQMVVVPELDIHWTDACPPSPAQCHGPR